MLSIFDTEKQVYIYQYEGHVCANKCKDSSCRSKKEQVNESFIHWIERMSISTIKNPNLLYEIEK